MDGGPDGKCRPPAVARHRSWICYDPGVKALLDFFPVLVFFAAYYLADNREQAMFVATGATMVACLVQVLVLRVFYGHVSKMHMVVLILVIVLGGASLLLQDKELYKWKPTVINWLFALVFLGSQYVRKRNCVQYMLGHVLQLPDAVWMRLNLGWVGFFFVSGLANLYVFTHFSEPFWVNFKLFGLMGMALVFMGLQTAYLVRLGAKHPGVFRTPAVAEDPAERAE